MKRLNLQKISPERRQKVARFLGKQVRNLKRDFPTRWASAMKEGLLLLADPKRPPAYEVARSYDDAVVRVFCDFGKGARPKAALSRDEAAFLSQLQTELERRVDGATTLGKALETASSLLLNGRCPNNGTVARDVLEPVLGVLGRLDLSVAQTRLV
ncbi:hypothetical protein GF318_04495 [Candidatus Micrarchaeota archaeon]|nr:hypothetical protein [Candidatus Micrarchaeota archaeon]